MLVRYEQLFKNDITGSHAIPAFNSHNLETTLGIIRAAVAKQAPVIIEAAQHSVEYAGVRNLAAMVASIANSPEVNVPVALHLDHTKKEEVIAEAIEAGFSSVMIDASDLPFEQNVATTKRVVALARPKGVWVQAELGRLRGNEDWVSVDEAEALFTDPEEALDFVKKTEVNVLAIAVGTLHGIVKFREKITPKLDIARIKKIKELVQIPLVLHGASGIPEDQIREAINAGINTINIDTELRMAFTTAVREVLRDEQEVDPRKFLGPAIDAVQKAAELKFDQFNATGKAKNYV